MASSISFPEPVGDYFPDLHDPTLTKGAAGKLAVIGGSADYTGAPFYSSYAPLKIGADMTFTYTAPEAATVIKSFSPDLIVHPKLDWDIIKSRMSVFDGVVFGPGLGRDESIFSLLANVLEEVKTRQNQLSMVIDADGLFFVAKDVSLVKDCSNVLLTPNHREFDRLWKAALPSTTPGADVKNNVQLLAATLGCCVFRKGAVDVISDGERIVECSDAATPRRCGGQGDLLCGATALFAHWAKLKFPDAACPKTRLLRGAVVASRFIRYTGLLTYRNLGRSMTASDMVAHIGRAVRHFEPVL